MVNTWWWWWWWWWYSKRHLQHDSMPFFSLASFLDKKVTYDFRLFFVFFAFPFSTFLILMLQWLAFYQACFQFKTFWGSIVEMSDFYKLWSIQVWLQEILLWVFPSNFWPFLCIFQARLSWSIKTGCHWKDLFFLPKLSTGDANFSQRWWCQKWNKGH